MAKAKKPKHPKVSKKIRKLKEKGRCL